MGALDREVGFENMPLYQKGSIFGVAILAALSVPLPAHAQERILSDFLTEGPFVRTVIAKEDADLFIRNYIGTMGGEIQYDLSLRNRDVRIVAIRSRHGSVSILITDRYNDLPDYSKNTRAMYYGDIRGAIAAARAAGLKILQEYTTTPGGAQGRIEMAPGYNIEIIEVSPDLLKPKS